MDVNTQQRINEREMNHYQRNMVDTCFEEGQYLPALTLLEQLRAPNSRPSISHVRQVIYIALHPILDNHEPNTVVWHEPPPSPSKGARHQKIKLTFSGTTVITARKLLMSFACTNQPVSLCCAIPSYEQTTNTSDNALDDSLISRASLCIKDAKSCWGLLADKFSLSGRARSTSPVRNRRRKPSVPAPEDSDTDSATENCPVGENAWPILVWLIALFERDEEIRVARGEARFSPLLSHQIPPPRNSADIRWDSEIPLSVVYYALAQSTARRRDMGWRLLTLLVNLTLNSQLNAPLFVASASNRLVASSDEMITRFFQELNPLSAQFRITLYQKFLQGVSSSPDASHSSTPRPQARKQPRAVVGVKVPQVNSAADAKTLTASASATNLNVYPILSNAEVVRILDLATSQRFSEIVKQIKFDLLIAHDDLQCQKEDGGSEWKTFRSGSALRKALDAAFGMIGSSGHREVIDVMFRS